MSALRSISSRSSAAGVLLRCRQQPSLRPSPLSSYTSPVLSSTRPELVAHALRRYATKRDWEDYADVKVEPAAKQAASEGAAPSPVAAAASANGVETSAPSAYPAVIYIGPVSKAFRFLKGFSLTSLVFSTSLSPFIFLLDAPLGLAGRAFLAGCAISTTVLSTAMIGWCSAPYVSTIEILEPPTDEYPNPAIRLLTYTTLLQPRYTTITTPLFLHESTRPLSTWQLAPLATPPTEPYPDIVAQTEDKHGKILGRWDGETEEGKVVKTFMVHEDLLEGIWGLEGWRSNKTAADA